MILNIVVQAYSYSISDVLDDYARANIDNAFENTGIDANELIDRLSNGNFNIDYNNVWDYIKTIFSDELKNNFGFISTVFILAMLSSLIENINNSFKNDRLIKFIVVGSVVSVLVGTTYETAQYSISITDRLILFINSFVPVITTFLATSGRVGTSGLLNPAMLGISSVISLVIKKFILPLSMISLVLRLTGGMTEKNHLVNFGNQIHKLLKWTLGLMFTVYVGIIGVIGVAAPKVDEITLKTTKYAVGNFIPYVGGMVADSVELILECSEIVKNSVGIAGLIGILSIVAVPCIIITAKVVAVNILGVAVSPVSNKQVVDSINSVSSTLSILLGMNVVVAIMYILSVTVIIFIGSA